MDEPTTPPPSIPVEKPKADGLTKKEIKELNAMEAEIRLAEEAARQAEQALADPTVASNAAELFKRQQNLTAAQNAADALLMRWEELEARR